MAKHPDCDFAGCCLLLGPGCLADECELSRWADEELLLQQSDQHVQPLSSTTDEATPA